MLFTTILLAISSSIDSLGIGITYGIKNISISNKGKLVIFFISFIITLISLYLGNILKLIFPNFIIDYLGSFLFILMGIFICFQALKKDKKEEKFENKKMENYNYQKTYSFFIKFLGITIKIIKDPVSSDFDNSNKVDSKEALFLGVVLSIDSLCVGIGGSVIGINTYLFPFLVGFLQLFFLRTGNFLGKKLYNFSKLPSNIWSIVSGILLILLGILKFLM